MDKAIAAVLEKCRDGVAECRKKVDAQTRPLYELSVELQRAATSVRESLLMAEADANAAPHTAENLEKFKQTADALDADAKLLVDTVRRVRRGFEQLERYSNDEEARQNGKSKVPPRDPPPPK